MCIAFCRFQWPLEIGSVLTAGGAHCIAFLDRTSCCCCERPCSNSKPAPTPSDTIPHALLPLLPGVRPGCGVCSVTVDTAVSHSKSWFLGCGGSYDLVVCRVRGLKFERVCVSLESTAVVGRGTTKRRRTASLTFKVCPVHITYLRSLPMKVNGRRARFLVVSVLLAAGPLFWLWRVYFYLFCTHSHTLFTVLSGAEGSSCSDE